MSTPPRGRKRFSSWCRFSDNRSNWPWAPLSPETYSAVQGAILDNLHYNIWGVSRPFIGKYLHDYRALGNDLIEGTRTAWLDKYTTS